MIGVSRSTARKEIKPVLLSLVLAALRIGIALEPPPMLDLREVDAERK